MKFLKGIKLTAQAAVAAILMSATFGCTTQQKQTTLQVITQVNTHIPEVVAAADTVSAVVAGLLPTDAALIAVADTAFDTAAKTLQALTAAYIANPNATTLQQIQAAITTLEGQINTATLTVAGIKNAQTQAAVMAALKGLLTIVTVVFGLISPTMTSAQLRAGRDAGIQLAKVRPYMDENKLRAELPGVDVDHAFAYAARLGL